MEPQTTKKQDWLEVESTHHGTWWVLAEYVPAWELSLDETASGEFVNPKIVKDIIQYTEIPDVDDVDFITLIRGYGARLSMPGYLDCTPWSVFKTLREARAYFRGMEDS